MKELKVINNNNERVKVRELDGTLVLTGKALEIYNTSDITLYRKEEPDFRGSCMKQYFKIYLAENKTTHEALEFSYVEDLEEYIQKKEIISYLSRRFNHETC